MAYILGFMYADGNITQTKRRNHYIAIYTADRPLLVSMRKCFGSKHKISLRCSSGGQTYRIQIGSSEWFTDVGKLGLFPNKTKRMMLPRVPSKFLGDFVRGYFDGDGNVWVGLVHKIGRLHSEQSRLRLLVGRTSILHHFKRHLGREGS